MNAETEAEVADEVVGFLMPVIRHFQLCHGLRCVLNLGKIGETTLPFNKKKKRKKKNTPTLFDDRHRKITRAFNG